MSAPYVPDAGNWINAFEAGRQARMTRRKEETAGQIGGAMARGDYKGAAAAAYGGGDYQTGLGIEDVGAKRDAATRRAEYGRTYAEGKGGDAVKAAYGAGDFEIGADLQKALDAASEEQRAQVKASSERIASIVAPLGEIPETDMAARKAYIAQHRADLLGAGYTEQQIDAFEPTNANLAPIYSQAMGLKAYLDYQRAGSKPDWRARRNADGSETLVDVNSLDGGAPAAGQGRPAAGGGGGFDGFYSAYLAPAEGGYAANDGNGAPVNFGINQGSNPDVDVRTLTPERAKALTYERYWKPSGADELPPGLAEVQADTAFNMGLGAAKDLLAKSGGDVNRYLALREQKYRAIAAANPDKARFLPTWLERNAKLTEYVGGVGGQDAMRGAGGPREVAWSAPATKATKDLVRPATAEEKAAYGIPTDVPARYKPDGTVEVVTGTAATLKRVPAKIQEGYVGNSSSITQIDAAIAAIRANPKALGLVRKAGETINQRLDPSGVSTRAAVANIGSLLIHDRSGAAVTAAEQPRLMPFIPQVTDTSDAAIKKLEALRQQYQANNDQIEVQYGQDSGYSPIERARPSAGGERPASPARAAYMAAHKAGRIDDSAPLGSAKHPYILESMAEADRLPKGAHVIAPDGRRAVVE